MRLESLVTLSNFHPRCIENQSLHPCVCAVEVSKFRPKSVLNALQFCCVKALIVVGRMLDVRLTRNPEFRPLGRYAPVAVDSGLRPETRKNSLAIAYTIQSRESMTPVRRRHLWQSSLVNQVTGLPMAQFVGLFFQ